MSADAMETGTVGTATRSVETGLEIAAPTEAVWRALTDPREIVRWFALEATVEEGQGGLMEWRWGTAYRWPTRIEVWEPRRRLRLAYVQSEPGDAARSTAPAGDADAGRALVIDFLLDSVGGGTRLRLVQSGFGRDAEWDDEYDGVRRGWRTELDALRHYLERHAGHDRHVWWASAQTEARPADVWKKLGALVREDSTGSLRLVAPGVELPLVPVRLDPPSDLVARVSAWDDALLRFWLDGGQTRPVTASLFLTTYDKAASAATRAALLDALNRMVPSKAEAVTILES
jgi:uncharacterized protein YndB with AHSA1/START domain